MMIRDAQCINTFWTAFLHKNTTISAYLQKSSYNPSRNTSRAISTPHMITLHPPVLILCEDGLGLEQATRFQYLSISDSRVSHSCCKTQYYKESGIWPGTLIDIRKNFWTHNSTDQRLKLDSSRVNIPWQTSAITVLHLAVLIYKAVWVLLTR